jgi:hypothetical protein
MIALTNEWSGSDSDIFSHAFKLIELGALIGKRTWGGVIGISDWITFSNLLLLQGLFPSSECVIMEDAGIWRLSQASRCAWY